MKNFSTTFVIWRLAILRLLIYCFTVGAGSYMGAMHGARLSELSWEDRFELGLGILVSIAAVVISFLDSTVKNLASGDYLPPGVESVSQTSNVTKAGTTEITTVKTTPENEIKNP